MRYTASITRSATALAVASGFALLQQDAKAIQFNISSIPGSEIRFTGSGTLAALSFSAGNNFQIDSVVGGANTAAGYEGSFSGSWTMGPVTTVTLIPLVETAPVSGTGTMTISDGTDTLTATVAWVVATSLKTIISVATLGVTGNVTGVSYSGSDPDLLAYAAGLNQTAVLSFTFPPPGKSLAQLVAPGSNGTTFSGNLVAEDNTVVPDSGTTLILLGLGLCGLAAVNPRFRKA
ncbi:MAG TPA: VPDSG-CTERM sorting domain-containing protein [Verrucomicrobiota bacterium]|nr:VPDSG-CTERM sorting domain-containing protein [Verrucomicrobiota bacterium]